MLKHSFHQVITFVLTTVLAYAPHKGEARTGASETLDAACITGSVKRRLSGLRSDIPSGAQRGRDSTRGVRTSLMKGMPPEVGSGLQPHSTPAGLIDRHILPRGELRYRDSNE